MADFDPKQFLAETAPAPSKGGGADFDPKQFLAETAPPNPPDNKPGPLESAVSGGAQGLTLGYSDELAGAGRAAIDKLTGSDQPVGDLYRKYRDEQRRHIAEAQAANPKTFNTANFIGSLGTGIGTGGIGEGAGLGAAVVKGAVGGGVAGLGTSDADVTKGDVLHAAEDTAEGAGLGGATGGLIDVAGDVLNPKIMRYLANKQAFKAAAGNSAKAWDQATARGLVQSRGQQLLDEGVVKFGDNASKIAAKAAQKANESGNEIGNILEAADKAGGASAYLAAPGEAPNGMVDGHAVAARIEELAGQLDSPGTSAVSDDLRRQAARFKAMGQFPLSEAQRIKNLYFYEPVDSTVKKQATNAVKGILGDEMESAVGRVAKGQPAAAAAQAVAAPAAALKTGTGGTVAAPAAGAGDAVAQAVDQVGQNLTPEERGALAQSMRSELGQSTATPAGAPSDLRDLLDRYKAAKRRYGTMTQADDDATIRANRENKNQFLSLGDKVLMGVAPGSFATKAALGAASRAARTRGDAATAAIANGIANGLEKLPGTASQWAPELVKAAQQGQLPLPIVQYLLTKKNPQGQ